MAEKERIQALVIDDEEVMRQYLKDVLEWSGFAVTLCRDGGDGLKRFYDRRYDIVITDLVMPGTDGVEAIVAMRRVFPPVPIVAMSGADARKTLLKVADRFHADATLQKPFTRQELMEAIERALGMSGAVRAG